jgi:hypothetical protein
MIYAIAGVLLIILLVIRIAQATSGTKTVLTYEARSGGSSPRPLPELQPKSASEVDSILDLPTEWVTYAGATPPLRLNMRGQSLDGYRYTLRKFAAEMGIDVSDLPPEAMENVARITTAMAYVVDWEGATYANGAPLAYSARAMAAKLEADPELSIFVSENAQRLSPPWPVS